MPSERIRLSSNESLIISWGAKSVSLGIDFEVPFQVKGELGYEEHNSLFVDLEREDINQVIRLLRRARDRRFGKDA